MGSRQNLNTFRGALRRTIIVSMATPRLMDVISSLYKRYFSEDSLCSVVPWTVLALYSSQVYLLACLWRINPLIAIVISFVYRSAVSLQVDAVRIAKVELGHDDGSWGTYRGNCEHDRGGWRPRRPTIQQKTEEIFLLRFGKVSTVSCCTWYIADLHL